MIKSTAKELKREAQFHDKKTLINDLQVAGLKVVKVEKVAYCESIYGCGGYLVRYVLNNGSQALAFTGRSSWMYTVENSNDLPSDLIAK